jgi:hypothetical protein
MSDPNVEQQLREFLDWQLETKREGKTLEVLLTKQDLLMIEVQRIATAQLEDHAILHRHGRAIKTLQQQVKHLTEATPAVPDWQASKEETTGVHELRAIQKAHADLQARLATDDARKFDEATWWSRQRWVWTVAAITIVFAATMTGCVGYVAYRIQALEKHTEKH